MPDKLPPLGGNAVIVSIFPLACPKITLPHGDGSAFMTEYSIPACPKGEVRKLVVYDAFEKRQDLQTSPMQNGQPTYIPFPVLATGPHGIGADLVRQWGSSLIGMGDGADAGPGIMIIGTNVADAHAFEPTREQLSILKGRQSRWFEALYYQGDQIANDKDSKQKGHTITILHRAAAEWLGRKPAWTDQVLTGEEVIDCPACFSKIKAAASICAHCRTQVRALPKSIASLPGNAEFQSESESPALPSLHVPPPIPQPRQGARS